VFNCTLLSNGSAVPNRSITLKLNSSAVYAGNSTYPALITNNKGYAWLALYLSPQANNNQTAYNVVASFAGDSASTAAATTTTLKGTTYAVCTTTQYNYGSSVGYEPSSNSTSITVTQHTTMDATTLQSSGQMQQHARSKGGSRISSYFSWVYS
jgi:hypothetical protein